MHGDTLMMLGRIDAAAAQYREVLRTRPDTAHAWWGLANLKVHALADADIAAMRRELANPRLPVSHRIVMGFALGKALADHRQHDEAFRAYAGANAAMRAKLPWDRAAFATIIDRILAAFTPPPAPAGGGIGRELIFVTGLPRSGTTLAEQILAAHPEVAGAGELPDLELVLAAESRRRGQPYPDWVQTMTPEDWTRLGHDYLERTVRWRAGRARHVDKQPGNWLHIGAIRAMLPGAAIIVCRRDPVENGWSCFRQLFAHGQHWSYDLADIGAYWRVFDQAARAWHERHPARVHEVDLERLRADPEAGIRALLEACALPFDAACLEFHRTVRTVRSASAAQVREPIRADERSAAAYGALLDPLRRAIEGN